MLAMTKIHKMLRCNCDLHAIEHNTFQSAQKHSHYIDLVDVFGTNCAYWSQKLLYSKLAKREWPAVVWDVTSEGCNKLLMILVYNLTVTCKTHNTAVAGTQINGLTEKGPIQHTVPLAAPFGLAESSWIKWETRRTSKRHLQLEVAPSSISSIGSIE